MTDVDDMLGASHREVTTRPGEPGRVLLIRRHYRAPVTDVWDACTTPDRLRRFFVPISGDLRVGGRFQFEGNAGGQILRCEPPHLVRVTWQIGDSPTSEVELRLAAEGTDTVLELEHHQVPPLIPMPDGRQVDPVLNDPQTGIWGLGTGWELGLIGLDAHLRGELPDVSELTEPPAWVLELAESCGRAWASVVRQAP